MPVGDKEKAFILRVVLELYPIFERTEIVADVQAAGGAHAAQDSFLVFHSKCFSYVPWNQITQLL
jgi:hypothetical protein